MRNPFLVLTILLHLNSFLLAQNNVVNMETPMLWQKLKKIPELSTDRILFLNELAFRTIETDPVLADSLAKLAVQLSEKSRQFLPKSDGLVVLGILARNEGNYAKAEDHFLKAKDLRLAYGDSGKAASCCNNLGTLYKLWENNYEKAEASFKEGISLLEGQPNSPMLAMLYNNLGSLYSKMGEFKMAHAYLSISLAVRNERKDSLGIANTLLNLGELSQLAEKNDSSKNHLEKSLAIFKRLDNQAGQGKCLLLLGNVAFHQEQFKRALDFYEQSDSLKSLLSVEDQVILYRNQGSCYLQLGEVDKALAIYQESRIAFIKLENHRELAAIFFDIGNAFLVQSKLSQAKIWYDSSLYFLKKTPNQQLKNEVLTNKIILAQFQQQKIVNYGIVGSVFMVLLLILMLFILRNQKQKKIMAFQELNEILTNQELKMNKTRQEAEDKERERIGKDLHDRIGAMLSTVKLFFDELDQKIDRLALESQEKYNRAIQLLDEACDEVRDIAHNLQSGLLVKFGLKEELESFAESLRMLDKFEVELTTFGLQERLENKNIEGQIISVIRELTGNVIKHSKATKLSIQVNRFDQNINIMVEDNGTGFLPKEAEKKGGKGLGNIASRVYGLNGTVNFDSRPGRGTSVSINIPMNSLIRT